MYPAHFSFPRKSLKFSSHGGSFLLRLDVVDVSYLLWDSSEELSTAPLSTVVDTSDMWLSST